MSSEIPLLTETFSELSNCPSSITEDHVNVLQQYLIKVYFGQLNEYRDINEARLNSFFKSVQPNLRLTNFFKIGSS